MSAEPKEAAEEVLAGRPGPTARRWLGPTALVIFVLFAIDSYLVVNNRVLPFDVPVARFIQQLSWGPVVYPMQLINSIAGYWQMLAGAVVVVAMFIFNRRAGWLMLIGSISSLLDNILKLVISRPRPTVDLVHILTPASGFSYPSGHAVFFTWLSFMLAFSLAPHVRPRFRWVLWIAAAAKPMAPSHSLGSIAGAGEPALIAGNVDTAQRRVEMNRSARRLGPR